MIAVEEAQRIILASVGRIGWKYVELLDALGRVLAENVIAPEPIPPWDNAAMDGYALRSEDTCDASGDRPVALRLIGTAAAGQIFDGLVEKGQGLRIMTGAPLPRGADAVIRQEDTQATDRAVFAVREGGLGESWAPRFGSARSTCDPGSRLPLPCLGRNRSLHCRAIPSRAWLPSNSLFGRRSGRCKDIPICSTRRSESRPPRPGARAPRSPRARLRPGRPASFGSSSLRTSRQPHPSEHADDAEPSGRRQLQSPGAMPRRPIRGVDPIREPEGKG